MTEVHVLPKADWITHEVGRDCVCGPACEPEVRRSGSIDFIYIHHALDGRERTEHSLWA
jgi:hypothetical protein